MSGQPIPEGSIVITPAEMYAEVRTLTVEVRDLINADKAEATERGNDRKRLEKLEARMDAVEKKLLLATGAAAALGGGLGTWLPKLLGS